MNTSTENVTLYATFVNSVLQNYENDKLLYSDLFELVEPYDLTDPAALVPMELYNKVCNWVEKNIGKINLTRTGRKIGETAYEMMVSEKMTSESPTPLELMQALSQLNKTAVQDPLDRGFDVIDHTDTSITMRKTQVFNRNLQFGVLEGIVRKAKVMNVKVQYLKEVTKGDEFDDYLITWKTL